MHDAVHDAAIFSQLHCCDGCAECDKMFPPSVTARQGCHQICGSVLTFVINSLAVHAHGCVCCFGTLNMTIVRRGPSRDVFGDAFSWDQHPACICHVGNRQE